MPRKNRHAVALGKLGARNRNANLTPEERQEIASKGGTARAEKLTPAERSKIAGKAGRARWRKAKK